MRHLYILLRIDFWRKLSLALWSSNGGFGCEGSKSEGADKILSTCSQSLDTKWAATRFVLAQRPQRSQSNKVKSFHCALMLSKGILKSCKLVFSASAFNVPCTCSEYHGDSICRCFNIVFTGSNMWVRLKILLHRNLPYLAMAILGGIPSTSTPC